MKELLAAVLGLVILASPASARHHACLDPSDVNYGYNAGYGIPGSSGPVVYIINGQAYTTGYAGYPRAGYGYGSYSYGRYGYNGYTPSYPLGLHQGTHYGFHSSPAGHYGTHSGLHYTPEEGLHYGCAPHAIIARNRRLMG